MSIQDIEARLAAASEVFDSIKDAPEVPVADADFFQFARTDMFELLARIAKLEGRLMSANDANTAWSLVSDTKDARIAKLEGALAKGELLQEFYIEGLEKSDAEIEGLKELLRKAQIHFCSNVCPCVWKTEDGQVHHDACIQMSQALKGGGRMMWIHCLDEDDNLCDGCSSCIADCKGHPKFNSNPMADNVIACDEYNGRLAPNMKYGIIAKKGGAE